jgi:hypothetical protein
MGSPSPAFALYQILKKIGDTEEQTTVRGTEETWFVSVPLAFVCSSVPNAFPDFVSGLGLPYAATACV